MALSLCRFKAAIGMLTVVILTSCSFGPAAVKQPGISASAAGSGAMEMYDTNGDGKVAGDELEKAASLKYALARLDTNKDGGVDADEVAARVNAWKDMKTGMTSVRCHVTLDGQPLPGASVTFEPESFLGDEVKAAVGTSDAYGDVRPTIAPEERPDPTLPGGAHFGLYKVKISRVVGGKETIPARYNTETILGQEVSYDDRPTAENNIQFALKSAT